MDRENIIKAGLKLGINTAGELLDPRFDYCFKRIFTASEEQSKIALIDFLNSILFDGENKIKDLTVVNNEIPVETYQQKKARFDIRVIFENGEQALVEMELNAKGNFFKRSLHNISRMYSSQEISGSSFNSLKKCYMVAVMGYNLFGKDFGYINSFTFKDKKGREYKELSDMQITYIELEKTAEFLDKPLEELTNAECWGIFLRYASFDDKREVLEKIAKRNRGINMAVNVLNYISKDTLERMKYEDEILAEIDHQEEINYARTEEQQKAHLEKLESAKEMLIDGEPISKIIKYFKLTNEEIEQIQKEI